MESGKFHWLLANHSLYELAASRKSLVRVSYVSIEDLDPQHSQLTMSALSSSMLLALLAVGFFNSQGHLFLEMLA